MRFKVLASDLPPDWGDAHWRGIFTSEMARRRVPHVLFLLGRFRVLLWVEDWRLCSMTWWMLKETTR